MEESHSLSETEVHDLITQAAAALQHCHGQGVVHRDVNPSNMMLTIDQNGDRTLKLKNFGLSTTVPSNGQVSGLIGSPAYVAPEVL